MEEIHATLFGTFVKGMFTRREDGNIARTYTDKPLFNLQRLMQVNWN